MPYKTFYVNFNLGLNTRDSATKIKDGECQIAQDCDLEKTGSIFTRKFKKIYHGFSSPVKTIFPYSKLITHLENGNLYNVPTLIKSNCGNLPFKCVEYNNVLYLINKTKKLRYDGANIFNMGIAAPTIAPYVVDSTVAGNPDGTYYYKYTYVDIYGKESNASPSSKAVTITTNKVTVGVMSSLDEKVVSIKIYRIGGTLTDWYFVGEVSNKTAKDGMVLTYINSDDQGGQASNVYTDNNYIYLANKDHGLEVYTINSAGAFTFVDNDDQGGDYNYIYGDGTFIYIGAGTSGLYVYRVDNNGTLTYLDNDDQGGTYHQIYGDNKFIYAASVGIGLVVYKVNGDGTLTLVNIFKPQGNTQVYSVYVDNKFVYIGCGDTSVTSGIYVLSIDDVGNPKIEDFYNNGFYVSDIISDNKFLYCIQKTKTLCCFLINNDGSLNLLDSDTQGIADYFSLYLADDYIYVARSGEGLSIYKVNNNGILTHLTSDDQGDSAYDVNNYDGFILLANSTGGILSYRYNYFYTDNIADSSLTTLFSAENNDSPNNFYYLTEHYQRLIAARTDEYPNSIEFSVEYQPEYWGNNLNQQFLLGGNAECTGLLSWGRFVVFYKKHQIYVMEGENPEEWYRRRADSRKGNIAPYATDFWKLPIIINYDGLYLFDGNLSGKFSDKINPWFNDNKVYLENAVGCVFNNKYYFGIKNETLVYDLLKDIFNTYNFGLTSICFDYRDNILYAGHENNIVILDYGNTDIDNDDSESVSFIIKSKAYSLHEIEGQTGDLRSFLVVLDTKSEDVTLNIYIDFKLKQTLTLNTKKLEKIFRKLDSLKGSFAEFEFTYSGTKRIQIDMPMVINPVTEKI